MRALVLLLAVLSAYKADAHEMLPSHPVLGVSYVSGVLKTQMHLFNKRQDVEYYEVGVFDSDWRPKRSKKADRGIQQRVSMRQRRCL